MPDSRSFFLWTPWPLLSSQCKQDSVETSMLFNLSPSQWKALLSCRAKHVYTETVHFNKMFQQKCNKRLSIFSKALLRNAILFLMLFSENNYILNFIKDLQRMPQLKFTVKSQSHSQNLESYYFRYTNSFGGQGEFNKCEN